MLLLAGCAPTGVPAGRLSDPTPAATPTAAATAIIQWFPPTSTPTPFPTAQIVPTVDQRPGVGAALLGAGIAPGQPWQTGKSAAGTISLSGSELTLAVAAPKGTLASLLDKPELGNFYTEVTAAPSLCRGADAYGLLLRAAGSSSFYRWALTCDGQQRLERVKNGALLPLQANIPQAGPPAPNHLAVWAAGGELRFFIDDIYQFSVRDPVFASGSLGVFARAASDTPLTITFSDLSVSAVTAPESTITPSPQPGQ
jgi:hypothetical protein